MASILSWLAALCFLVFATAAPVPALERMLLAVDDVSVKHDERTGDAYILVRLAERKIKAFETFTTDHMGQTVEFRLGADVLMNPIVKSRILDGSLRIDSHFTQYEAEAIARRLMSGELIDAVAIPK